MEGITAGVSIVDNTLTNILDPKFDSPEARVLLLAIGMQESAFEDRIQKPHGPAHSFWQEEPNGIKAVLNNSITKNYLIDACGKLDINPDWYSIYQDVINNDELACVVARLMLYADSHSLPAVGDSQGAWEYYLRTWRPGKPRPDDWDKNYGAALGGLNV